jgi:deferrochelatase/peroxidase EfeB
MTRYQGGIFYNRKSPAPFESLTQYSPFNNSTFALVFLRILNGSSPAQIRKSLEKLWKMYALLRTGKVNDSGIRVPARQLSVLFGYGPKIFNLNGVKRTIPENFKNKQFLPSKENGYILDGCGIKYSDETQDNLGLTEDIMIQIISTTQLATYRAVAETSKQLGLAENRNVLKFSRFYTGFRRDDGRSWLGFHDEISNMTSGIERRKAIFIDPITNDLRLKDYWTKDGTYLAFIRIEIDVRRWEEIDLPNQELIIGRQKKNGLPLLGVDRKGRPMILDKFRRAKSITPNLIRDLRDHPDYFRLSDLPSSILKKLDIDASVRILSQSHIGRTRHIDGITSDKPSSRRIYRQSFDFIEPLYDNPGKPIRLGLNFISFQNDPSRLLFILTDPNWMGKSNFGGETDKSGVSALLSVLAAGIFFVPPLEKPFPGISIFS